MQYTDSLDFAETYIENLKTQCMEALNSADPPTLDPSDLDPFNVISATLCPNDCSGQGNCTAGLYK